MTRRFTKILAALALLVFMTPSMVGWGQSSTWSHEFVSGDSYTNNSVTVNGVTWAISTSQPVGTPSISFGNMQKKYALKFGSSGTNYFPTITLTTDYFTNYNVQSVTVNICNNGSKEGTLTVVQGSTTIGTDSKTFGQTWTDLTANTNTGSGGQLSISYTVAQACGIHSITVTYSTGSSATATNTTITIPTNFNTDVYTSTTAGQLTATVTYDDNGTPTIVPNASVTWGSSDEDVATVDANGNVTLVAAGTTNITATFAGNDDYATSSGNYELTVTNSEPTIVIPEEQLSLSCDANENGSFSISFTNGFIPNLAISPAFYSDAACQNQLPTTGDAAWIVITETDQNSINYRVAANTSTAARTAYLKVNAASNSTGEIVSISNVFTVTQAAPVVDYATLPFVWEGGVKADFLALNGTSAHGLGSGYGDNNAPYRIQFDDTGDYIQVKTDSQPGKVTIGVKMIGGSNTSTITIQGSADGETFTNIQELTISGAQGDELTLETTNAFAANVRYVRMLFTKGSNVGVGPIIIAEYVAPQEYTLGVTSVSNAEIIVFDATNPVDNNWVYLFEGVGNAQVLEGTPIAISVSANEGYTLESLMVNDVNHVADISGGVYTFTMPSDNVTISATAVVHPLEATFIFNTDAGLQALGITKPETSQGTNLTDMELVSGNVTMTSTDGGTPTRVWNSSGNTTLRVYKNGSLIFSVPQGYAITKIIVEGSALNLNELSNGVWTADSNPIRTVTLNNGNSGSVISTITVEYGCTLEISDNQWYLIASPVGDVAPTAVANMTTGSYALYRFDQQGDNDGKEWINYKNSTDGGFDLEFGKGYLYANENGCTLTFTGTPVPFIEDENNVLPLDYVEGVDLPGYNLLGNPFNETVWTDWEFYVMNGGEISLSSGRQIAPMQGFIVIADAPEGVVTLNEGDPIGGKGTSVTLNVSRNRGNVIDRARVRFDESRQLPKFQLFEGSTKVYIPQGDQDYAVVRSEGQGELPVNFHASENGTYTLSMDVENMDMNYLHLIDNMTGMDVDLLQTPSYTFEAKVNDYESRFRLVFAANNEDGVSTGSTTFAFYSNGNWIINNAGEATLQVVDLTGRILSSETVNGSVSKTINAVPGVYMLRLINGENVNVQKIVVR